MPTNKSGSEFLVNTTTGNNQTHPAVTGLANGRFVCHLGRHQPDRRRH